MVEIKLGDVRCTYIAVPNIALSQKKSDVIPNSGD